MKPSLFSVLCEIKEKTGKTLNLFQYFVGFHFILCQITQINISVKDSFAPILHRFSSRNSDFIGSFKSVAISKF